MAKPQPKPQQQQSQDKPSLLGTLKGMAEAARDGPAAQEKITVMEAVKEGVRESPIGQMARAARAISDSPGAAPIHAFVRQGADEIAQVLAAFPDSNVKPQAEQGQIFEPTPQLITAQIKGAEVENDGVPVKARARGNEVGVHGKTTSLAQMRQYADAKAKEADDRMEKGHQMGGPEMDF